MKNKKYHVEVEITKLVRTKTKIEVSAQNATLARLEAIKQIVNHETSLSSTRERAIDLTELQILNTEEI